MDKRKQNLILFEKKLLEVCSKHCYARVRNYRCIASYYRKREKRQIYRKACLYCKTVFPTSSKLKVFCNKLCNNRYRVKNKARPKTCLYCQKTFKPKSSGQNAQKHCSKECVILRRRANQKEKRKPKQLL